MRNILLIGSAALVLSGCSFLGHGPSPYAQGPSPQYGYAPAPATCPTHGVQHQPQYRSPACNRLSTFNVEGSIGKEFIAGGSFTSPNDVAPAPGLTPGDVAMQEAYDEGLRIELGGSYALNPNRKVTLMGSYTTADGNDVVLGSQANAAGSLRGTASDYKSYGIEAGLRQYFAPQPAPLVRSLRPYVEGKLGAAKVDDVTIENLRDNNGAVNGGMANFSQGGWVPTAAGLVGVEAPIFRHATLGLETGLRYRGSLDADTTDFGAGGGVGLLEGINNSSSTITIPVTMRARYRF